MRAMRRETLPARHPASSTVATLPACERPRTTLGALISTRNPCRCNACAASTVVGNFGDRDAVLNCLLDMLQRGVIVACQRYSMVARERDQSAIILGRIG